MGGGIRVAAHEQLHDLQGGNCMNGVDTSVLQFTATDRYRVKSAVVWVPVTPLLVTIDLAI
jgi:hypothetical protein